MRIPLVLCLIYLIPSSAFMVSVVTGANRGIGLALVKKLQDNGEKVVAVCRSSSDALRALQPEKIVEGVDVSKAEGVQVLEEALKSTGAEVSLCINNAGILRMEGLDNMNYGSMEEQFRVNSLGPLRVTEAVLPFMKNGGKVVFITSRMGSIGDASGGMFGYRMSKAALNIGAVALANTLKSQNRKIAVGIVHPGMVATDMTSQFGTSGSISPTTSADGIVSRTEELNMDNSGGFWHAVTGEVLPW